jgi:hypothetical protein
MSECSSGDETHQYLLITLHKLQSLTLDHILLAKDVGEHWWQSSAFEVCEHNSQIELTSILILDLERQIILLYDHIRDINKDTGTGTDGSAQ